MTSRHLLPIFLMTIILLIAAAVRFHEIEAQSFWYDEGVAYGHSQRSLAELLPRLRNNVHVPAYFGSLAIWEDFTGSTEFALRGYSALWSIISVAAAYALAKRLFHPGAGLAAALFTALNTFSIYYGQETRMYAMLAAVGALSMWVFVALVRQASRYETTPEANRRLLRLGLALAALNTLGEYTHFSFALVMLAQGVLALLWLGSMAWQAWRGDRRFAGTIRALIAYSAANLLAVAAFLPWLTTALSQVSSQPNISDVLPLDAMLRLLQGWFAVGMTFERHLGGMGMVMYLLLIFALLPRGKTHGWWQILVPVLWVLISATGYLVLELYARYLRFLLPAQIALAVWMGRGVWALWTIVPRNVERRYDWQRRMTIIMPKVTAVVATLAFAYTQALGLPYLVDDPAFQRDDYRGLAQKIVAEAHSGDAIILSAPGLQEIFGYYYRGDVPVYTLPAGDDIRGDTLAILNQHDRIFAVLYGTGEQDPQGLVTATLNSAAYQINSEWIGDVRLERYAAPVTFSDFQPSGARFGEHITLQQFAISAATLRPNDALQIQLDWLTDLPLASRYKVFIQLLRPDGTLAAQRDSEPGGGEVLTTLWQPDQVVSDKHALAIPADLAPAEYTLIIGLYDLNDPSARLAVGDGDYLVLATVTVTE